MAPPKQGSPGMVLTLVVALFVVGGYVGVKYIIYDMFRHGAQDAITRLEAYEPLFRQTQPSPFEHITDPSQAQAVEVVALSHRLQEDQDFMDSFFSNNRLCQGYSSYQILKEAWAGLAALKARADWYIARSDNMNMKEPTQVAAALFGLQGACATATAMFGNLDEWKARLLKW